MAALAILGLTAALTFLTSRFTLPGATDTAAVCLLLPISLLAGLAIAWWAERQLRRRWLSGRWVELSAGGLRFRTGQALGEITYTRPLEVTRWRFKLGDRGRQVLRSTNWECFALRLVQDQAVLTVYCFLPPGQARSFAPEFHDLPARSGKGERLRGPHSGFLAAERFRAAEGLELEPEDFVRAMEALPESAFRPYDPTDGGE